MLSSSAAPQYNPLMAPLSPVPPVYCAQCKIGTLDADGLCILCGAPQIPPSRPRLLLAAALSAVTSAPAIGVLFVALALILALNVGRYVAPSPAWNRRLALLNPLTVPFAARSTPHGTLIAVIAPLIGQFLILLVLLLLVFFFMRRRRPAPEPNSQGAAETS
jgi:hypothetical protein